MRIFRLIVFSLALIGAAYAATYTWLTNNRAQEAGTISNGSELRDVSGKAGLDVIQKYPFSPAAVRARSSYLDAEMKLGPEAGAGLGAAPLLKSVGNRALASFGPEDHPYVTPDNMAVTAVILLLLALILPGTRFRATSFILLLLFAAASIPNFMPEPSRLSLFHSVGMLKPLYTHFPWIAGGMLLVSLVTFVSRKCSPVH